ncbi:DUF4184 family protein, partial [Kitasatospora sp. LaBMicrA B282]|uniref:DUF4184 family protein n=1 Tax=Kitasatospora sp. LaBMicrA B282 TaxID=3420949 RepID=UPI003D118B58
MPFTFSHPAAVLPLLRGLRGRGPLVACGLVAGSMAPDLPFFAESWLPGVYRFGGPTHRWWAVATVDVALTGVLVAGWQAVLRRPLLALLPVRWAEPAAAATERPPGGGRPPRTDPPPRQLAAFALSAAIGAAGHVGWDAFTHPGRVGGRLVPVLERRVAGVPLCTVLQYGSSALALAGLGDRLRRELGGGAGPAGAVRRAEPARQLGPERHLVPGRHLVPERHLVTARRPALARAVVGVAALAGAAHRVRWARRGRGPHGRHDPIADLCFGAGGAALAALAGLGVLDRLGLS